jgi:tetratricopeptide (TPR) repeat protein
MGCAAAPAPTPQPSQNNNNDQKTAGKETLVGVKAGEELIEAAQAYNVGNPVRAVQILETLSESDSQYAEAQELLAKARADVDAIASDWLAKIDGFEAKGQFRMARARGLYILDHFPVGPTMRIEIDKRFARIKDGVAEARNEIRALKMQAADQLLRHDFVGGLRTLRRAETIARKFDFREALELEQQMAAAEFRFAQERPPEVSEAVADKAHKSRSSSRRRRGDKSSNGKSTAEPVESPHAREVQELVRAGNRHRKKGAYYQALLAYDRAHELDPENKSVRTALDSLKARRRDLIKEYLSKANEHFLKQDLEGAVPYFLKIQKLDPTNEDAIEGIKMHDNLARIRRQRLGK